MYGQHGRCARYQRDGPQILYRIVGQIFVQAPRGRKRCAIAEQQCVSIRCRLGGHIRSDREAGAWPVLDDHRLTPTLAKLMRKISCHDVMKGPDATGDDTDVPCRVTLSEAWRRAQESMRQNTSCEQTENGDSA